MEVVIKLEYWQAVRLKSLVRLGEATLDKQHRTQFGIDGFTDDDLNAIGSQLDCLVDTPQYANPKNA